jgi:hypothetical protein
MSRAVSAFLLVTLTGDRAAAALMLHALQLSGESCLAGTGLAARQD